MSEVEVLESETMALVIPGKAEGEIVEIRVDLSDPIASAVALDQLREFENTILANAKRLLTEAVLAHWRLTGERSLELPNRLKAEVKAGTRNLIDPDVLEERLREAGMPEDRIDQLISTTQERKVDARKAKTAATANPDYKAALEAATTTYQETPGVTIRRR